jgi:hypothetical protein
MTSRWVGAMSITDRFERWKSSACRLRGRRDMVAMDGLLEVHGVRHHRTGDP